MGRGVLNCFCGTPNYMAPEMLAKQSYSGKAVDIWALGILLFTVLSGYFPFKGLPPASPILARIKLTF